MSGAGDLWERLISYPNLFEAVRRARQRKSRRPDVLAFEFQRERELCRLRRELQDRTYVPGPYFTFPIHRPKPRLISAAPFRDRVVHHALCNVLEPIFERGFIFDSYACRSGKGAHAAVDRFTRFARRWRFVLHGDVRKYFPSIDHAILKELLASKVEDAGVLWLAFCVLDHSNPQEPVQEWFDGDDLFGPGERRRGLPLGNQTSQFFANVYLNPLDQFIKHRLRVRGYLRYMDDFVVFGDDTGLLAEAREACREFLRRLRLRLHPGKGVISRTCDGTRFLGYRVFPEYRRLPRPNVVRMRRRLRYLQAGYAVGRLGWEDVRRSVAGWWGHASHADTRGLQQRLFGSLNFAASADEGS